MARGWTGGAALIALSLAGGASAQDSSNLPPAEKYGLRLQYREFRPSLTGQAQKGSGDTSGTLVDVTDDLGIADKRTPLKYNGDTEVPRTFTYGDTRYERFERVVTSIKGAYLSRSRANSC